MMTMDNFAENVRDKSPPVTDHEVLAAALAGLGTMSPRLRKLYDDAATVLRAQDAEIEQLRAALADLHKVLRERHYGRMPDEVQRAYDAAGAALKETP